MIMVILIVKGSTSNNNNRNNRNSSNNSITRMVVTIVRRKTLNKSLIAEATPGPGQCRHEPGTLPSHCFRTGPLQQVL